MIPARHQNPEAALTWFESLLRERHSQPKISAPR
jgi:hypothetical protein